MFKQMTRTAIGMAVLLTLSNSVMAAAPLGQLKAESKVEVVSGGVSTIVENDVHPIFAGDMVKTMGGSSALIRFTGDVGFIQSSENATVTVKKPDQAYDLSVEDGQAQFMFQNQQDFVVHVGCLDIKAANAASTGDTLSGGFVNIAADGQGYVRANNTSDLRISTENGSQAALLPADSDTVVNLDECGTGLAAVMGADAAGVATTGVSAAISGSATGAAGIPAAGSAATAVTTGTVAATSTAVVTTFVAATGALIAAGGAKSNPDPQPTMPNTSVPPPTPAPAVVTPQPTARPSPPRRPTNPTASPVTP